MKNDPVMDRKPEPHDKYIDGTRVRFDLGSVSGFGIIRGIAVTAYPVVGPTWIVELCGETTPPISDTYPFSCMAVSGCFIKEVLLS